MGYFCSGVSQWNLRKERKSQFTTETDFVRDTVVAQLPISACRYKGSEVGRRGNHTHFVANYCWHTLPGPNSFFSDDPWKRKQHR